MAKAPESGTSAKKSSAKPPATKAEAAPKPAVKADSKSEAAVKPAPKPQAAAKPAPKPQAAAKPEATAKAAPASEAEAATAKERLGATGRNDACPCGSGKKYKKCHLLGDEQAASPPPEAPDAKELAASGWRLFEQRRPGAAEKEFRAALALDSELTDAQVGIGMSRLSAGDADGAKQELALVIAAGEKTAEALQAKPGDEPKDAFNDPAVQPYIRAAHALGCLAYDEERFEDAVKDLARVHAIDDGTVGVEARLISAKALMKLEKPAEAATLLEPPAKAETNASRAQLGLALARFSLGDEAAARKAINAALDDNPHYGKALLGRVRRHVENVAAAGEGTLEQALLYAQTYADVWTDGAKKFLETVLDERAASKKKTLAGEEASTDDAAEATP